LPVLPVALPTFCWPSLTTDWGGLGGVRLDFLQRQHWTQQRWRYVRLSVMHGSEDQNVGRCYVTGEFLIGSKTIVLSGRHGSLPGLRLGVVYPPVKAARVMGLDCQFRVSSVSLRLLRFTILPVSVWAVRGESAIAPSASASCDAGRRWVPGWR